MSVYADEKCPICNKKFANGDDIVVCPFCGAPHHRSCFIERGSCAYTDKHQSGFEWKPSENSERTESPRGKVYPIRCARCGTDNNPYDTYCKNCGASLKDQSSQFNNGFGSQGFRGFSFNAEYDPNDVRNTAFAYNFTPYGGVDPAVDIEGASVEDLAIYIGDNSQSFIPRLHFMNKQRTKISWNIPAFIFGPIYYLYRKAYLFALIAIGISLVCSIPAILVSINAVNTALLTGDANTAIEILQTATSEPILSIFSLLSTMARSVLSLFFNYFYGKKAAKDIIKIKKNGMVPEMEKSEISRKGGVNRKLLIGLLIFYFVLIFIYAGVVLPMLKF